MLREAAARSVDLATFDRPDVIDAQAMRIRGEFAAAYAQLNDLPRMKVQLEAMRSTVTEWPWRLWGGVKEVRRLRRLVNLA